MFLTFFQKIDFFGSKFHFYSGKTPIRGTTIGGFLTLFILIMFFLLIIIFGDNLFSRKNPSVTMSIENNLLYEQLDLKKESVQFAFRIEDYDGNFINVSNILYFRIYYYTTEPGEDGRFRSKIKDEYLNYHICNDSDFENNQNLTESFGLLYCPELGGKKFGGYWDSPNLYYFEIQIFYCENGTQFSKNNNKCTNINLLNKYLSQDNPKYFALYYPVIEFNPLSYKNPLIKIIKNYYYCLSTRLQRNDDIFLKKTILNDDKGWLIKSGKNSSFWGVDNIKSTYSFFFEEDLLSEGASSKIYELNLYTLRENNFYIRSYTKIQSVIAIVGSLMNIIIYFFGLIGNYVGENLRKLEILDKHFEFEDNNNQLHIKKFNSHISKKTICLSSIEQNNITNKIDDLCQNNNNNFILSLNNVEDLLPNQKEKSMKHFFRKNKNNTFKNTTKTNSTYYHNIKKKNTYLNIHPSPEQSYLNLIHKLYSNQIVSKKFSSNKEFGTKYQIGNYEYNPDFKKYLCCSKKYYKYSKILEWYYINLVEVNRYLKNLKEMDFIKRILLNEIQIKSLNFFKKINLKNAEERNKLLEFKNTPFTESEIISYFKMNSKNLNVSKIDEIIYDNLVSKIKDKILNIN